MGVREALTRGLAGQLGHPHGFVGRGVGHLLNRVNGRYIRAAADALADTLPAHATVADIGFGGGAGLPRLLRTADRVHGVEISHLMLRRALGRHRAAVRAGRLVLHEAPMTALPFADGELDGLLTLNTVYFVAELDTAFRELARVVTTTVLVGIGEPDAMADAPFVRHGFRIRPVAELRAALTDAGLAVDEERRLGRMVLLRAHPAG